jgi:uncharacterized membrane protein
VRIPPGTSRGGSTHSPARIEALTDGVFAIAMTLLAFRLAVPDDLAGTTLPRALLDEAPEFVALVVSFVILGVYWFGHRSQFTFIVHSNRTLSWLNILFLLAISVIPFSADVLGRFHETQTAIVAYGVNLIAASLAHFGTWRYATHGNRLVEEDLDPEIVKLGVRLSLIPIAFYLVAIAISPLSTIASIVIFAAVPLLYVFPLVYRLHPGRRKRQAGTEGEEPEEWE